MEDCRSGFVKEYSKGFRLLLTIEWSYLAVIDALKKLKKESLKVIIYTDSKYVVDSVEKNGLTNGKKQILKTKKM